MIQNLVIMMLSKEISKEEVNNLEQRSFSGKIVVLSKEHHKASANYLFRQGVLPGQGP